MSFVTPLYPEFLSELEELTHASKEFFVEGAPDRGGSVAPAFSQRFFRMCFIVACRAQADEIAVYIRKLRIFVGVFDVMHYCGRRVLPVPFAALAGISVAAQDMGFFSLPFYAVVIKLHYGFAFPADA